MSKTWKDALLRSGVPLEYDAARILAEASFHVDADFPYLRLDVGDEKEHSVDLIAEHWSEELKFSIYLLVECKYRSPEKKLLLLAEPNIEMSLVSSGGTVTSYDEFVPYNVLVGCFRELDESMPVAYKGVELHASDATERDFVRSIEQLRYAMPPTIYRALDFSFGVHPGDCHPFFIAKIMVTNAELLLLKEDTTIESIMGASALEQVTDPIERALFWSEYGPDYERHFKRVFADDKDRLMRQARRIEKYLRKKGKKIDSVNSPTMLMDDLCSAGRHECMVASNQFFISHIDGLGELAADILEGAEEAVRGKSRKRRFKERETDGER